MLIYRGFAEVRLATRDVSRDKRGALVLRTYRGPAVTGRLEAWERAQSPRVPGALPRLRPAPAGIARSRPADIRHRWSRRRAGGGRRSPGARVVALAGWLRPVDGPAG